MALCQDLPLICVVVILIPTISLLTLKGIARCSDGNGRNHARTNTERFRSLLEAPHENEDMSVVKAIERA